MVDRQFSGHFFWKVEGTVCIHVSHVQLPYTVINMQDGNGGHSELRKTRKVLKTSNLFKGGREHKRPYCIS